MQMKKVRIKLPSRLHWANCSCEERRMLIDCIYEQNNMLGLIKLCDKSIVCNSEETDAVKKGIKEVFQYLH